MHAILSKIQSICFFLCFCLLFSSILQAQVQDTSILFKSKKQSIVTNEILTKQSKLFVTPLVFSFSDKKIDPNNQKQNSHSPSLATFPIIPLTHYADTHNAFFCRTERKVEKKIGRSVIFRLK